MSISSTNSISDSRSTDSPEVEIHNRSLGLDPEANSSSSEFTVVNLSDDRYFHVFRCQGPGQARPALMEAQDWNRCPPSGDRELQLAPHYEAIRMLNIVFIVLLLLIPIFGIVLVVTLGSSLTPILGLVQIVIAGTASLVALVNLMIRYYLKRSF
ncbi:MAG: hypothetical protein RRZ67_03435 [Victivallaceae bacterium]